MKMTDLLLENIKKGNIQAISRCISMVENKVINYELLLYDLPPSEKKIIGVTGAPGAGKSTLIDGLIEEIIKKNNRVAIVCVDPTSPFSGGALLGDRLRMNKWYNQPAVYIRSVASRGALGGLCPTVTEICDILKAAPFDYIIVETVGVGQNEVEVAELADVTVVVYVPEAGDEVQTMKAGLIEIADVFVVNKADRPGAELFARNLQALIAHQPPGKKVSVIKTVATEKEGTAALLQAIEDQIKTTLSASKKIHLLAGRAYQLIQRDKMKHISRDMLEQAIQQQYTNHDFNLYRFAAQFNQ